MADFAHEIANWAKGVITSIEGDKISDEALTGAKNTQFVKTAQGMAALATRPGMRKVTTFRNINGVNNAKYLTSYPYAVDNATAFSHYMIVVDEAGYLWFKEPDDSWSGTSVGPSLGDPVYPQFIPPEYVDNIDSTIFNNTLVVAAGPIRRWLKGQTLKYFGLNPPSLNVEVFMGAATVPDTSLPYPNFPATNFPADVYDVFGTFYDSTTGAESSPAYVGEFTITAGQGLAVTCNSTATCDKFRVYIRRQSTQANAYLVVNPKDDTGELLSSDGNVGTSSTAFINPTAEELADFIIPMPSLTENNLLSPEAVYVATYGRRLIAASRRKLFYSKLDRPEAFPPQNFEIVDLGDGGEIVGLLPLEDELLAIFTTKGVFGLFGIDPQYWVLKPISTSIGCVGNKSIVKFDGGVAWWSPQAGPVVMKEQQIEKIGTDHLDRAVLDSVQPGMFGQIASGWDPYHKLIIWSVACNGSVKNNCLLPYQYELGAWCASEWDGFGVPVMATGLNKDADARLFCMDHYESLYYLDSRVKFDGIDPTMGTVEGTTSVASAATSLTTTGLYVFSVVSNNMAGQRITFVDASGHLINRATITSNTATVLNWDTPVDLVTGGKWYVSTPFFELRTKQFDGGQPFLRKRFDRLYLHLYQDDPNRDVKVYYEINQQDKTPTFLANINANAAQTATLDATWDVPVTVNIPLVKKRLSVFVNGHELRWIIRMPSPGPVMVSKLTVIGRLLNERYYA